MVKGIKITTGPFTMEITPEPYSFEIRRREELVLSGTSRAILSAKEFMGISPCSASLKFVISSGQEVGLDLMFEGDLLTVRWSSSAECDFEESYLISSGSHWYGGGFLKPQYFPLNGGTLELRGFPSGNVQTPYWYTSSGTGILVHDYKPLNWSFDSGSDGLFRFGRRGTEFKYDIILGENARDVYFRAIKLLGRPHSSPAEVAFTRPIYSTWAEYKTAIDQGKTLQYAADIVAKGFPIGTMELDDKWEIHYGDFEFDNAKFPNPRGMVDELHEMGFVVTLWVYPFINLDSVNYPHMRDAGFLVRNLRDEPLTVKWWNGEAGVIDFTYQPAADWIKAKLLRLQDECAFDGFKFDAGDAIYFPPGSIASKRISSAEYGDVYMKFIADNFPTISETRVSTFAQSLGLLTRHGDKDTRWGIDNGLHSIITTTLSLSTIGYPYVLPDMIGGNEYGDEKCSSELLIRWVELSAPMPSMQFSIIPWRPGYDDVTAFLNREYAWFHYDLSPYILELVRNNLQDGSPLNRPLFFDHDEPSLYGLDDEFMLGESLLFAPIVTRGATSRDITLPGGRWLDLWDEEEYGKGLISDYAVPLYKLPAFMDLDRPLGSSTVERIRSRLLGIESNIKSLER